MPAYSFQERFVPWVLDGSKAQTIRKRRVKGFAKKDDTLYLYYGLRTKYTKKLREEKCSNAVSVIITNEKVYLCSSLLASNEIEWYTRRCSKDEYQFLIWCNHSDYNGNPCYFRRISSTEANDIAWEDGFRPESKKDAFDLMLRFWKQTHKLPFVGDIIYWNPSIK